MSELKPCPFCGSDCVNDTTIPEPDKNLCFSWVCPDCAAVGPVGLSVEQATTLWNADKEKQALKQRLIDAAKKRVFTAGRYYVVELDELFDIIESVFSDKQI